MAYQPTDPVKAKQIAEHAVRVLEGIRHSATLDQLNARVAEWRSFADAMGVVSQIREHVREAINETAIHIKARRVIRDPTGEAA